MNLTNQQKAILHIAKKEMGLDDETYRDILYRFTGKRSSTHIGYHGFAAVMKHFEACGFRGAGPKRGSIRPNRPGMATEGQIKKIYKLWWMLAGDYYEAGENRKTLRGFLKARFAVDHEMFLTFRRAGETIEAVKQILERRQPGAVRHDPAATEDAGYYESGPGPVEADIYD
jgi:hypothetical protein